MATLFSTWDNPNFLHYLQNVVPAILGRRQPEIDRSDKEEMWTEIVNFPGFDLDSVSCQVKNGKAVIVGQGRDGDDDNYFRIEKKRSVDIPTYVDPSTVVCRYVPGKFALLQGRKIQKPMVQQVPIRSGQEKGDAAALTAPRGSSSRHASTQAHPGDAAFAPFWLRNFDYNDDSEIADIMRHATISPTPATATQSAKAENASPAFEATVDVSRFDPNEVSVELDGDMMTVEATRDNTGSYFSGRENYRRYIQLPQNVDSTQLRCTWRDGNLCLTAPYISKRPEVVIPIRKQKEGEKREVQQKQEAQQKQAAEKEEEKKAEEPQQHDGGAE